MFTAEGQVVSDKPYVEAVLSARPALVAERGARSERRLTMLVDTGARFTLIPEEVAISLGIPPTGTTDVGSSVFGTILLPVFPVTLSVDFTDSMGTVVRAAVNLHVIGLPPPRATNLPNVGAHREGILAMDFLNRVQLIVDGPGRTVHLRCADPRAL
jgi:predicted aspartyl protease